jgi:hypothetical protein
VRIDAGWPDGVVKYPTDTGMGAADLDGQKNAAPPHSFSLFFVDSMGQ